MKIYTKDLSSEFVSILNEYKYDVNASIEVAVEECAKSAVKELRQTSPRGSGKTAGEYAKAWTYTKDKFNRNFGLFGVKVHNGKHYRLTHLLENGHDIINKNGVKVGRSKAIPHIKPVEEKTVAMFEDEIVRRINDIK